jgi:hypothetical protein
MYYVVFHHTSSNNVKYISIGACTLPYNLNFYVAVKDGHAQIPGDVEIWDPTQDDGPPPPVPETPSRIPYATPPIAEEDEPDDNAHDRRPGHSLVLKN